MKLQINYNYDDKELDAFWTGAKWCAFSIFWLLVVAVIFAL